ncbi:MAG: recombinase family protein [Chitinophagaceae bacterium]|nr:recombinase family protein [Chitinophagaceae bacterium]
MLFNNKLGVNRGKSAIYNSSSFLNDKSVNSKVRLLQYAIDKNLKFDFYNEVELPGKSRPEKKLLLQKLRTQEYSMVVVFKLNCWARSSKELILELKEILDNGIQFVSISENKVFSAKIEEHQYKILDVFAEFELSLISQR